MAILFGLSAALGWGAADFLVRYSTRFIGTYRTLFFMQFFGLLGLSIYLVISGPPASLFTMHSWQAWCWLCVVTSMNILSSLFLYRAYQIGALMIISPIAAGDAAVTVMLSLLAGEKVSQIRILGMGLVLVGIILVTTSFTSSRQGLPTWRSGLLHRGVIWALLAALGFGTSFWLLGFRVVPELGPITPSWFIRLFTPCVLALCAPIAGQSLRIPHGQVWWYLTGLGVLDTLAFIGLNLGMLQGQVSVISVISSLYAAVTVLLARIILSERLRWSQWLGVGIVLIGVILINV